jgi:hypothetical protein
MRYSLLKSGIYHSTRNMYPSASIVVYSSRAIYISNIHNVVRFEVFIEVTMKNAFLWDVAPCRSWVNRSFGWTYRVQLQPPAHPGSSLANFSTLKMEAMRSCKTSVHTRYTRRHITEDGILHPKCWWNNRNMQGRFVRSTIAGGIWITLQSLCILQ